MDEIDQNRKKPATKRQSTKKKPIVLQELPLPELVDNWQAEQPTTAQAIDQPIELREWAGATPIEQLETIEQQAKRTAFEVTKRLQREKRFNPSTRDELIKHARTALKLGQIESKLWAYEELDRRFPPPIVQLPKEQYHSGQTIDHRQSNQQATSNGTDAQYRDGQPNSDNSQGNDDYRNAGDDSNYNPNGPRAGIDLNVRTRAKNTDQSVVGLAEIPENWPKLSANASLAEEIQWVQANRLAIVKEVDGITTVDLSKASPPPSMATLGWLETSIRAYAKYCEIAAKASNTVEDGRDQARRERLKIDEVRNLLSEMAEA